MNKVLSVSQYLILINETLRQIPTQLVIVEGEVSDFRVAQGKWVSFGLKDEKEQAVLKCFMTVWQLKVELEDGMRVQLKGYPKVYERFGSFKMNVQEVAPVGEGALRRAYELLKKKLETEGLFDVERKRSLMRFVERVGLITSRDAAAYGDFVQILNNRWGGITLQHAHVHVQGRQAVREIVGAFEYFNGLEKAERPDVLILTRGGGGLEDLHAFNDEEVARAIFRSKIPVVVGVGHERDESLADFVADVRASTPSNAAERVVPSRQDVLYELETIVRHMDERMHDEINLRSHVIERATNAVSIVLERQKQRLHGLTQLLRSLDPKRVLARGYSIVTIAGAVLTNIESIDVGTEIGVHLAAGSFEAEVKRLKGKGQQKLV